MNDLRDLRRKLADIIRERKRTYHGRKYHGHRKPKEIIEQKIDDCDCYLAIFDRRWGYIPAGNNPENLSVTAIEYQRAKKNRMPILILISKKEKDLHY